MYINQFEKETEKLQEIISKYRDVMEYYKLKLDVIPKMYMNNPELMMGLCDMYERKLELMKKNIEKPYFARMDFKAESKEKVDNLYISKVGVFDEDENVVTVDWRSPIAAMYYDSNIGRTSYVAPEGVINGELLLKRQFEIENSKLISFQDVDTVANDELLKPYLNAGVDNRLKNIVSTIQQEQNKIIREKINKNIIVQGVAGSGKTTVALHRIAYLVYNNKEKIKPNQYMVIGPNKFFVKYISSVLPDLDVNDVKQLTYQELCEEFLDEKYEIINDEINLIKSIKDSKKLIYQKMKVSLGFKDIIDEFFKNKENKIINQGLTINGYNLISVEKIKEVFESLDDSYVYKNIQTSILKKFEKTHLFLQKYVEENNTSILADVSKQYEEKVKNLKNLSDKEKENKKYKSIENEIKNKCNASLKKYFTKFLPDAKKLYIEFLETTKCYKAVEYDLNIDDIKYIDENIKYNIECLKKNKIEFEDLCSLLYFKYKIYGNDNYKKYKQIAIDEAQDLGEFNIYALKCLFKDANFSIYGDIAQSIYQYRSISNWEDVITKTFKDDCEIEYLLKSYRTTTEVMNSANLITSHLNLKSAVPVIRHGEKVSYLNFDNLDKQVDLIYETISKYKSKGFKTVAIISKNENEARLINEKINMKDESLNVKNIIDSDTEYDGGICTVTSYLAKGLEFDGVIIVDASDDKYDSTKQIDMKLLYVAMTRPIHELSVLYKNQITKVLSEDFE